MNRLTIAAGAALVALTVAGCGAREGAGNKSKAEANSSSASGESATPAPAAGGAPINPGRWEATVEILNVEGESVTPQMVEQMKAQRQTSTQCITPEQAANWAQSFADAQQAGGGQCTSEGMTMADGRISGTVNCTLPQGTATMTLNGDYSPELATINMENAVNAGGQEITMTMRSTSRRVGECNGTEGSPTAPAAR